MMRFAALLVLAVVAASCSGLVTERAAWTLTVVPNGAVLEVRAQFGASSCTSGHRVEVTESSDEVVVEALYERERSGFCSAEAWYEDAMLILDAPLGDRDLRGCDPTDRAVDCRQP